MVPRSWSILVAVLFLSAGCVGVSDESQDQERRGPAFDESTGAVRGLVTDDSFVPVAGVDVVVVGEQQRTETDAEGVFNLSRLEPGAVTLAAAAPGYQEALVDVVVEAGGSVETQIMIIPVGQTAPYHETKTQTAFMGCNFSWRLPGQTNSSFFAACGVAFYAGLTEVDRFRLDWGLGPLDDVTGLWVESEWESTQALGSTLNIWWSGARSESDFTDILSLVGQSPVRGPIEGDVLREKQGTPHIFCEDPECTITSFHYGWAQTLGASYPVDVGATIQQRVDDYVTVFHNGRLPQDFTVLPDA